MIVGLPKGSGGDGKQTYESKTGTWISVGVVGGVIVITYFVIYGLYMARI